METQLERGFPPGPTFPPQASEALPVICPILLHQKVDFVHHFRAADLPPASFIVFPQSWVARLLLVGASLQVLGEPIHVADSV